MCEGTGFRGAAIWFAAYSFTCVLGCGDGGTPSGDDTPDFDSGTPADASAPADAPGPDADLSAPICTITAPVDGTTVDYDQNVTFVASASDPEDGPLSGASVVWTTDLDPTPLGTGLFITLDELPVPGIHTIACTATDSTTKVGSDQLQITSRSPVPSLNHPGNGEVRPASDPIEFTGDGRDFEDGLLPDKGLVWTSNLDGALGIGRIFQRTLSSGTNVVTLTVTDSDNNSTTESITLTITP